MKTRGRNSNSEFKPQQNMEDEVTSRIFVGYHEARESYQQHLKIWVKRLFTPFFFVGAKEGFYDHNGLWACSSEARVWMVLDVENRSGYMV